MIVILFKGWGMFLNMFYIHTFVTQVSSIFIAVQSLYIYFKCLSELQLMETYYSSVI